MNTLHYGMQGPCACYRAYLIGETTRVEKAFELDAKTDAEATEQARQLVAEHPVELWDRSRMVLRLEPKWPEAEEFGYFSSSVGAPKCPMASCLPSNGALRRWTETRSG